MADLRISELPVLLAADAEANDDLALADYSASETRRLTLKGAVQRGVSALIDDNIIPGAKLVDASVTTTQIAADAITAVELADDAVDTTAILDGAVTDAKLASGIDGAKINVGSIGSAQIAADAVTAVELADDAVDTAAVLDGAITNAKLASGIDGAKLLAASVSSTEIAANAITATELADDSVDTAAILDAAVTDAKLASGIDGTKLSDGTVTDSKLASGIDGAKLIADSVTAAQIAPGGITSSELATNSVTTTAVIDGAINNAKLASGIDGGKISAGTIGTSQIATDAITDVELADDSVDTAAILDAAVTNPKIASGIDGAKLSDATVTNAKLVTGIDGAKLSASTVAADKLGTVANRGLDQSDGNIGHTNSVTAATRSGITFDAHGHITGTTALVASDLPIATDSAVGAVNVPATSGLTVTAIGALNHSNSVTAATVSGITFDDHGHIVSVAPLTAGNIPVATALTIGGVSVPAGSALSVSVAGDIAHEDSPVVVGEYTKVTVNQKGHVTAGATLTASDIPSLDASKITTGTFSSAFLAANSVTAQQLADYGIAQVSETQPVPEFAGQWWINPTDRSAYIWVGTVSPTINGYWLLVGYGSPTQLNLRFGGTYDANTNTVSTLNQYGTGAGLTVGQALNAPNSTNNGVYLAVTTNGTGTTPAPISALAVGDWVLSQGTGANWTKVAVVSGASGTFNDYDILCDGTYFNPDMPAVADVRDALELVWGRVQIATGGGVGVVRESTEVVVDNSTGEMTIGVVDDGTY